LCVLVREPDTPPLTVARRIGRLNPPLNAAGSDCTVGTSSATVPDDNTTTVTLTFFVPDKNGIGVAGATILPSCTGVGTFSTPAVTNASGITTCTFKTSSATAHTVSFRANGIPASATVIVTGVSSQTADATKTTITADVSTIAEGAVCHLTIQAKQANDTNKTVGGDTVTVTKTGGTATGTLSGVTDNGDGTYSATYTGLTAGTAQTLGGTINTVTISGGSNPTCAVTAAASYTPGDILDNVGFETNWDGFTDGSGSTPSHANISRATDKAYAGATSVKRHLTVNPGADAGPTTTSKRFAFSPGYAGATDRIYTHFAFYFDGSPTKPFKFHIFEDSGSFTDQWGGIYVNGAAAKLSFVFAHEVQAQFCNFASLTPLLNGWHSLELDYWLNGDDSQGGTAGVGYPSARIWLDDADVTFTGLPSPAAVHNSRLYAMEKATNGNPYAGSRKIGTANIVGVLNANNTNDCNVWVDKVSVSTLGRVGPA
jgi:hypothetical protein